MIKRKILPVILCGGKGSRLWPLSRETLPKQFLRLFADEKDTLMQKTIKRIANLDYLDDPVLICNNDHRFIVKEQLDEIQVRAKTIFLEPCQRNTAPAIAIAALYAKANNEDPHLLVLASDHEIKDSVKFLNTIKNGLTHSESGILVTFGITPTSPETGFGYIEADEYLDQDSKNGSKIRKFIEKPNKNKAIELFNDKRFFWNSGCSVLKPAAY